MIAGQLEIQLLANIARLQSDMTSAKGAVGSAMKSIESSVAMAKQALGAFGIGLGVGYFVSLIKGSIDAADHLKDLSKSTGIIVEDLAGLRLLAKQTGTDLDGLAKGVLKMSVEMGKDPDKFVKLGVTAKGGTEALKQLADIFNTLPDINQRNALAQKIFSKSWAELAPALSEGGAKIGEIIEKGAKLSGVTKQLTDDADEFNDKLAELTSTGGLLTRTVGPILPLLNTMADDLIELQNETAGADKKFNILLETLKPIVIVGGLFVDTFSRMGKELGGWAAQLAALGRGDFKAFAAIRKEMLADADKDAAAWEKWQQKILDVGVAARKTGQEVKTVDATTAAAAAARAAAFLKEDKDIKETESAYHRLMKTLEEKLLQDRERTEFAKLEIELQNMTEKELNKLTGAEIEALAVMAQKVDALKDAKTAMEAYIKVQEQLTEIEKEAAEAIADAANKRTAAIDAQDKVIDQIKFETTLIGLSNDQRTIAIALRALETSGIEKQDAAYTMLKIKIQDALAGQQAKQAIEDVTKKARDDFGEMWRTVESTGKSVWTIMTAGGEGMAKSIGKAIKSSVIDLLYQLTARKWLIQIGAGLETSLFGSSASAGSQAIGAVSTGSSLYNAGTTVGGWFSAGAGGGLVTEAGTATYLAMLETGATTSAAVSSGIIAGLSSIPVYGWIAAAAVAAFMLLSDDDEPPRTYLTTTTSGEGGPVGTLAVTGNDNLNMTVAQAEAANAIIATWPAVVQEAMDGFTAELAPGGTALEAWAIIENRAIEVGRELGLAFDDMQLLAPMAQQNLRSSVLYGLMNPEEQIADTTERLQETFSDLGFVMPTTNAGLMDIVSGLDLTTEAGQDALATINRIGPDFLRMTDAAEQATQDAADAAEAAAEAAAQAAQDAADIVTTALGTQSDLWTRFATDADQVALATQNVNSVFADLGIAVPKDAQAFANLVRSIDITTESGRDLLDILNDIAPSFEIVTDAAIATEDAITSAADAITDVGIGLWVEEERLYDARKKAADEARSAAIEADRAIKKAQLSLTDWLDSIGLDDSLSPLTAQQKLDEAQSTYVENLMLAQGGNLDAIDNITKDAEAYLDAQKDISGFGGDYSAIFSSVRNQVQSLARGTPTYKPLTQGDIEALSQEVVDLKVALARLLERGNEEDKEQTQELIAAITLLSDRLAGKLTEVPLLGALA